MLLPVDRDLPGQLEDFLVRTCEWREQRVYLHGATHLWTTALHVALVAFVLSRGFRVRRWWHACLPNMTTGTRAIYLLLS